MRLHKIVFFWLLTVAVVAAGPLGGWAGSQVETPPASAGQMVDLVTDPRPWRHLEPYSEQRPPLYLGSRPREMELGLQPADQGQARLPRFLRDLGQVQFSALGRTLTGLKLLQAGQAMEFEAWPVMDDTGRLTWAVPRWRKAIAPGQPSLPWRWLRKGLLPDRATDPLPVLPVTLDTGKKEEAAQIFTDFLEMPGLYDKPVFGDCLWTEPGEDVPAAPVVQAWLPTERRAAMAAAGGPARVCRALGTLPRLNGRPVTWIIRWQNGVTSWPADLVWRNPEPFRPLAVPQRTRIRSWPANFDTAYRNDLIAVNGEGLALFPLTGRSARFTTKNNALPDNQLILLVEYLEERYAKLGIKTFRQEFTWRGRPQANLIAVIEPTVAGGDGHPVLLGDHLDTAFCEDTYEATHQRVPAPGADDNASASAVLLRAAEALKGLPLKRPVWLVHLTGEEYPADDLGAREFLGRMLKEQKDLAGLILMDLIGWRQRPDSVFQINPGESRESLELAALAWDAARNMVASGQSRFFPVMRTRFDPRGYLYNTDGLLFSDMGYPVILLNEHMNRLENLNRVGYHHTQDKTALMDFDLATTIARVAIETAARLAGVE